MQLCPLAEVAHLLSLGMDFKGPGHIWLLWGGDEAHRTLKAWGELETVKNRTAAVGGTDTVGLFFFFNHKRICQSEVFTKWATEDGDDGW